jgi:hypothetical protein
MSQRFIYEYRLKNEISGSPELVYNMIKVDDLPKTYRRVGRATWNSSTRVWFKVDEGKWMNGAVYLVDRDDQRALKEFVNHALERRNGTAKLLDNANKRLEAISAITEAVEDEDC